MIHGHGELFWIISLIEELISVVLTDNMKNVVFKDAKLENIPFPSIFIDVVGLFLFLITEKLEELKPFDW